MSLQQTFLDITRFTAAWYPSVMACPNIGRGELGDLFHRLGHPHPGAVASAITAVLSRPLDLTKPSLPVELEALVPHVGDVDRGRSWKSATITVGTIYGRDDDPAEPPKRFLRIESETKRLLNLTCISRDCAGTSVSLQFQRPAGMQAAECWQVIRTVHNPHYNELLARLLRELPILFRLERSADYLPWEPEDAGTIHFSPVPDRFCDGWFVQGIRLDSPETHELELFATDSGSASFHDAFSYGFLKTAIPVLDRPDIDRVRKMIHVYSEGSADDLGPAHFTIFRRFEVLGGGVTTVSAPSLELITPLSEDEASSRWMNVGLTQNSQSVFPPSPVFSWENGQLMPAAVDPESKQPAVYWKFTGDGGFSDQVLRFGMVDAIFRSSSCGGAQTPILEALGKLKHGGVKLDRPVQVKHGPFVIQVTPS